MILTKTMRILLPWKKLGHDGKPHRAKLTIDYDTTQDEEIFDFVPIKDINQERREEKKKKSGLRKCPGHKHGAGYDKDGRCYICKGYK